MEKQRTSLGTGLREFLAEGEGHPVFLINPSFNWE